MDLKLVLCLILLTISHSLLAAKPMLECDEEGCRDYDFWEEREKQLKEDNRRRASEDEVRQQIRNATLEQDAVREREQADTQRHIDGKFRQIKKDIEYEKGQAKLREKKNLKEMEKLKTEYDLAKKKIDNLTSELVAAKEEIVVLKASHESVSKCPSGADSADKEKLNIVSCQSLTTQDLLISCNSECFETTSETSTSSESLGDLKCTVSDSKAVCGKNHRVYQRVSEPAYLRMCNILAKQVHDAKRGLKKERIDIPGTDVKVNKASAAARQH